MAKLMFLFVGLLGLSAVAKDKVPGFQRDPASMALTGTSSVSLDAKSGWIRVDGDSAKALYDALKVPEKNDQGEAGPDIYFKHGKSYHCWMDKAGATVTHACSFSINNVSKGQLK